MERDRTIPEPDEPLSDEERDEAIIAADDTGMLAGERLITESELEEAAGDEGDV